MTIRLYNTASRNKEEFKPITEGKAGIYVCGVTVYDLCHIGHARSAIVFDVLVRYLKARGFDVTYIRNFTDVDDKIIERARETGKDSASVANEYIHAFHEDMDRLGLLRPDKEPRATEHILDMIDMIKTLLTKGFAYIEGADVFYSVESFPGYGKLSGRRLEDMKAGSRVAVNERKRHPLDFALWKGAKPGEPRWDSPWGPGRPGWHIECSVMSNFYLGPTFDIHGGGMDLLFPHHENERAQSMAACDGSGFARFWVHNGFVTVESEKMSKSLGNFITIRDALKEYPSEVLRLFLLSKHYRSPLDFSKKDVLNLQSGLIRIYRTLQRIETLTGAYDGKDKSSGSGHMKDEQQDRFLGEFVSAMDDDLNTAGAIGLIFEKVKEMNRILDAYQARPDNSSLTLLKTERENLIKAAGVLGLLEDNPEVFFSKISQTSDIDPEEVEKMIRERSEARARKDWAMSDSIRDRLQEMGIVLEDGPQGTIWRRMTP
ncbi:MAG TPA: cysteine--tRNA ligase [Desulfatiglandales bacterium]|nr:cysteine--tRNA ligase [Desulfatiglandales bacterium]